ncbi:MAG TPA: SBBP repeat-containing protein [Pyrinomonadaceae bacterium]|nr:SBBP repeat-containing protein [Pyrinomonadaceae bacterium]
MNLTIPHSSRIRRVVLVLGIVCLLATFAGVVLVAAHKDDNNPRSTAAAPLDATARARVATQFGRLPLSFERNKGQLDERVKFVSHGAGYDLFLTATEAVLSVQKPRPAQSDKSTPDANVREGTVLRLTMLGANNTPEIEGEDELPGKVNYFVGNDEAKWRRNISTYRKVHIKDAYPGIDVVYYGKQRELEYDFVIAAGANPKLIRFRVEGAEKLRLDKTGGLVLDLKYGEVTLNKPVIYQLDENGNRREVKGAYVINGTEVRFKVERFDSSKSLIIDPVLSYSTLLGSSGDDNAFGIAVDAQGSAYVTGTTTATNFPTTPGAFKTTSQRSGAYVTKLDPTGSSLIYSTYLTANNGNTNGLGIAVDSAGNAHVTGTTSSSESDFPIVNGIKTNSNFFKTTDAAANWNNQNSGLTGDAVFLVAVAPNSPNTIYAGTSVGLFRSTDAGANWTRMPGTNVTFNFASTLMVDPSNPAVVYLGSFNGFFRTTDGGNNWSSVTLAPQTFVQVSAMAFDPVTPSTIYVGAGNGVYKSIDSGTTWIQQNNFGVPGTLNVRSLAIDPTAPLTIYAGTLNNGLFKSTNGGGVWTAMNNGMGGGSPTNVNAIVIDPANPQTIYAGNGNSSSQGGINKSINGAASWTPLTTDVPNAGVTAMVATSSAVYAAINNGGIIKTTNGGSNWTNTATGLWSPTVMTLVKHPSDPTILYAGTIGSSFPDAFVTKLNSSGSALLFSTLLGGNRDEIGNGIAVDGNGNILVAGQTGSLNFPFANAVRSTVTFNGNCTTGFVTKINPAVPSYTFSTYLGGGNCDTANAIATDNSGNVYVTGRTGSTDFPTANPFQANLSGSPGTFDAFVSKLTPGGSLAYSTYLGGSSSTDTGFGIATDVSGNAYVTGLTFSTNFPTMNPIQATNNNSSPEAFVTKINSTGSALIYSTYLGGSGSEQGRGIAIDSANNAFITGFTDSIDFPLTQGSLRSKSPIYKSVNAAASWNNENYGFPSASLTGIVIHPTQPSTVYVGAATGVFKSTNGGRTWTAMNNGLLNTNVTAMVIDPLTPSTLYVATTGLSNQGIYKSTDGGASWNRRSNGINTIQLISLAIDPVTPNTLYTVFLNFNGTGIYKTVDGADNWTVVGSSPTFRPAAITIDPLNHTTLYAPDENSSGGIFKSTDSAVTWQQVGANQIGQFGRSVAVSPLTAGLVYAETGQGLFRSVDGGVNWVLVPSRTGKIVFDPVNPATVYLLAPSFSNTPGLSKSTDNGQTWTAVNKGLNSPQASVLAIDPLQPSILYLASSPSGGSDAFVTKINAAGNSLVYSTLIGGALSPDNFSNVNAQALAIALDSSGNAYVTGLTSSPAFPVTPNAYQPFIRGSFDVFISKLVNSYIISGHVMNGGSPVSGAEIVLSDGSSLTSVMTESDGSYQFSRLREGGSFTVTASKPHFSIAPPSQSVNNLNGDQVFDFSATPTNAPFHFISGQITENGGPLPGVPVTLSGSQPALRTTDSSGNYAFELADGGNYTVTPSIVGFNFGPPSQTFNNLSANQTANFAGTRQSFVVTNTNNHGSGSLREAIVNANATPGTDTIVFNIPGPGVKTITPLTVLPDITDAVVIDATTQPGYSGTPLIELDGSVAVGNAIGLVIKASGTAVRGFAVVNFRSGIGIWLNGCDNNQIRGNYIGVAPDGITAKANARGIALNNSSNNVIGGTTATTRNVISGNLFGGIDIAGSANVLQGNFIGTNAAGTAAFPSLQPFGVSIVSSNFADNVIGGTAAGAGNLISGNQTGIQASGNGTIIQGNLVGTDLTGTTRIFNLFGIQAPGSNVLVGGLTPGARNVISGNSVDGVLIRGAGSKLQGNFIGTDITGTLPLGNNNNGVVAGDGALIGGTVPEARNIISANGAFGNVVLGHNNSGSAAIVQGNYIGTDVTGTRALGGSTGINILTTNHIIGGTVPGARNVISGNSIGIQVGGSATGVFGNVIQGNFIGLNAAGTGPLPNDHQGIAISDASNNTIGGTQPEAGNKIAFNLGPGVTVSPSFTGASGNTIRGNSIFSNNGLGIDLGANGVTANDSNDQDTGPNNLQNFPVVTLVTSTSNSTTIQGTLQSLPNTTFQVDLYSSAAVDPSGNGEGAQFMGSTAVNTDNNGNGTFNVTLPVALAAGRVVTATATDPNGNTSEFSAADSATTNGSVQFTVNSIQVIEDLGVLSVTVQRTGGTTGSLSVDYATSDGTAIAGQDYTAVSGTLNFGHGETSKTIQIPILDDGTTEQDEKFTLALRNPSTLEALGSPSTLDITLQDRSTTPALFVNDVSVVEGNSGSTNAVFTVSLTAATGRAVSVDFGTGISNVFGGKTCGTPGVDFENASGTLSFSPGTTSIAVAVKVCGDTNAEANEIIRLVLLNATGATLFFNQGTGTIVNDDALILVLEENGPTPTQAAAIDDLLALRDPFRVVGIPDWFPAGPDKNTRVALYARNLQLNPGEAPSAVIVTVVAGVNQFNVAAQDVREIPNSDLTQVVFRLPNNLVAGTAVVSIRAHTLVSNTGTIRIVN